MVPPAFCQPKMFAVAVALWYQVSVQDFKVEATLEFLQLIVIKIHSKANAVFDLLFRHCTFPIGTKPLSFLLAIKLREDSHI